MPIIYIAILLLALWVLVRGVTTLRGQKFPDPAEQRFRDKPWLGEYQRASGRADVLTGVGVLVVFLVLWLLGVQETLGHFLFTVLVALGMAPGTIWHALVSRKYEALSRQEADALTALFQGLRKEGYDLSLLSLDQPEKPKACVCYPKNARLIGCQGRTRYCYINGYYDKVFAANPENREPPHVYPLALDFKDFLRLILACGSAGALEQARRLTRAQFQDHLQAEAAARTPDHQALLDHIAAAFDLTPMKDPYGYVKDLQLGFDDRDVQFTDEYYKTFGIKKKK